MAGKAIDTTPRALQKIFICGIGAVYVLEAAPLVLVASTQYANNPNLSAYYVGIAQIVVVPLVLLLAAWLLSPRKITRLGKAFEAVLIAILGYLAVIASAIIAAWLPVETGAYTYPWASVVMPTVTGVLFIAVLWWLRISGRWKQ